MLLFFFTWNVICNKISIRRIQTSCTLMIHRNKFSYCRKKKNHSIFATFIDHNTNSNFWSTVYSFYLKYFLLHVLDFIWVLKETDEKRLYSRKCKIKSTNHESFAPRSLIKCWNNADEPARSSAWIPTDDEGTWLSRKSNIKTTEARKYEILFW